MDADLVEILPDKYPNRTADLEGKSELTRKSSNKQQLSERFGQFSLKPPPRQRAEDQQKHTNV
jgi:hypothetical protein